MSGEPVIPELAGIRLIRGWGGDVLPGVSEMVCEKRRSCSYGRLGCLMFISSLTGAVLRGVDESLANATNSKGATDGCSMDGGFSESVPDGESVIHEGLRSEIDHEIGAVKSELNCTI